MKLNRYNPLNMNLISEDINNINIGDITIGNYNNEAITLKLDPEAETIEELAFFLENKNNLNHTKIGLYKSQLPISGILPTDNRINTFLIEAPGVSDIMQYSDRAVFLNAENPEYLWLNVFVGPGETKIGENTINFRFVFNYV
jgi:hypothetical protein